MSAFTITRADLRGLAAALSPHTGKASDDTPHLGRARFVVAPDRLNAYASDGWTSAAISVPIIEHLDDELPVFDLPTGALRAALAVFKAPTGQDWWGDGELRVSVLSEHVVLTESGDLIDGRSLQVLRLLPDAESRDRYPDVPRLLVDAIAGITSAPSAPVISPDLIGRYQPAARAWTAVGVRVIPTLLEPPSDQVGPAVVVQAGPLLGVICAIPSISPTGPEAFDTWTERLTPMRRPVRVQVSDELTDDLRSQAAELLKHGSGVHLTVVKAGDPS